MRAIIRAPSRRTIRFVLLLALVLGSGMLVGAAGAATVTAAVGDEIPLSGAAPGADEVYLFLTGPNLPANGVRLDDIRSGVVTGDPSSFTRATVAGDIWRYTWNTRTGGGTLDAGIYTVYVLTQPVGRRDLGSTDYASITVVLTRAGIEAAIGGEILVTSRPVAGVYLDGEFQGTTPIRFTDLEPGEYRVELRAAGYLPVNESVKVEAGRITNFTRSLKAPTPSPSPPTTAATPLPTPTQAAGPLAGAFAAAPLARRLLRQRGARNTESEES
jgi:hypothetical protein